jgi:NADP-dependent 3-hydroxy acid dehydrogenase YdfG
MNLQGKKAIVTGVSKGIGKALVHQLLDKGVTVAGWSRSEPDFQHENFKFFATNIADEASVANAFDESIFYLGGSVDILINNAGFGLFRTLENHTSEEWENMFAVNVHGIYYTTKRVVPLMKEKQIGHIINIASIAALQGINEASGYCGTKFAVRGISQALYQEVKKFNVKVTCVMPGSVNTDFFNEAEGITANPTMLGTADIANTMIHLLETPDNYNTSEIEIRPMNPKYS